MKIDLAIGHNHTRTSYTFNSIDAKMKRKTTTADSLVMSLLNMCVYPTLEETFEERKQHHHFEREMTCKCLLLFLSLSLS